MQPYNISLYNITKQYITFNSNKTLKFILEIFHKINKIYTFTYLTLKQRSNAVIDKKKQLCDMICLCIKMQATELERNSLT